CAADTVQPSRASGANPLSRSQRPLASKRLAKRLGFLLVGASLCTALVAGIYFWPKPEGSQLPNPPLKLTDIQVNPHQGQEATLLGNLARSSVMSTAAVRADDSVRVLATLSTPAHCYLIAFNPDGTEQLCYPEDPDLPAVKYPENKNA